MTAPSSPPVSGVSNGIMTSQAASPGAGPTLEKGFEGLSLANGAPIRLQAVSSPIKSRDFAVEIRPTENLSGTRTPSGGSSGQLGSLRGAKGQQGQAGANVKLPPSLQAKMAALANRSGKSGSTPPATMQASDRIDAAALLASSSSSSPVPSTSTPPSPPPAPSTSSSGTAAFSPMGSGGLSKRRQGPGLSLNQLGTQSGAPSGRVGATGPAPASLGAGLAPPGVKRGPPPGGLRLNQSDMAGGTPFANFNRIVDPSGKLNFDKKAVLHAKGVDFSNGSSFSINMDELELLGELGKGNYGTVQRVRHKVTQVVMAMKEIRLELDDAKLKTIITELDILHRSTCPEIVDFYGAFFVESCVYYCMEYMDAGSIDTLAGYPVPEDVLARITVSMVRGLKFLKDELQTMHRDIKPTNVLINRAGAIKLCDFGVSGQLERSLAKTNIGCQSYMAPERIKGESQGQVSTYTVSSDVWSLGLTVIEFSLGHYPYPPETYSNVFAQLQAIVHGDPPRLAEGYSKEAIDFVSKTLRKIPRQRPTYAELLEHPFLKADAHRDVDMSGWVAEALQARAERLGPAKASTTSPSSTPKRSSIPPSPPSAFAVEAHS